MSVIFETSLGDLVIDFFIEKHSQASLNFIKLSIQKFFVNSLVFEVQNNFIAKIKHSNKQPTTIFKEINSNQKIIPKIEYDFKIQQKGLIGLVNSNQDQTDSYFFITLTNKRLSSLEGKYEIIGKIVEGLDIVDQINQLPLNKQNRPIVNIRIKDCLVINDPFDQLQIQEKQNSQLIENEKGFLEYEDYIKIKDDSQMIQKIKEQDLKKKTDILELVEYFPEADSKPCQNTLFVAKLNKKTLENELEEIFSQFGPIENCEIKKDWKTKQSLGYAFITFQNDKDAEKAYFKMQNAVIDNKRIHIDFSQSVHQNKRFKRDRKNKIKKFKQFSEQIYNHAHAYACSSFIQVYKIQSLQQYVIIYLKNVCSIFNVFIFYNLAIQNLETQHSQLY